MAMVWDTTIWTPVINRGYPAPAPYGGGINSGQMWGDDGHVAAFDVSTARLAYDLDTSTGHSGSPIYEQEVGCLPQVNTCVRAIHTAGTATGRGYWPSSNSGKALSYSTRYYLYQWAS